MLAIVSELATRHLLQLEGESADRRVVRPTLQRGEDRLSAPGKSNKKNSGDIIALDIHIDAHILSILYIFENLYIYIHLYM